MPQMAPISWLILFMLFSLTFMLFNVLNFYCFNNNKTANLSENNLNLKNNYLNWKW